MVKDKLIASNSRQIVGRGKAERSSLAQFLDQWGVTVYGELLYNYWHRME